MQDKKYDNHKRNIYALLHLSFYSFPHQNLGKEKKKTTYTAQEEIQISITL